MAPTDPVDEADEESFPASDAPTFSTAHAGVPAAAIVRVLIDVPPDSSDAGYFRTALARLDGRAVVSYADADGEDFARALPDADVVVAGGLTDDELARATRLRWFSSVAAGLDEIATPALLARG